VTAAALPVGTAREVEHAVFEYLHGWLDRSPARIAHVLHPKAVRRTLVGGELIDATATPPSEARVLVDVMHVEGANASVVVRSLSYVEYLHLVRTDEGWQIVDALWHRA
jgi:hypothetical protein